jgi:hypothetical protein
VDRIDSYLGKHLWAQIVLSLLVASAVSMLLFPERSFGTTLVRTAVISAGGIAIMVAMRRKEERAAGGSADRLVTLERKLLRGGRLQDEGGGPVRAVFSACGRDLEGSPLRSLR